MKTLRLCWPYLRPYWGTALLALVAVVVQTAMDLLVPWPLKLVLDNVVGKHTQPSDLPGVINLFTGGRELTRLGLLNILVMGMLIFALLDAVFAFLGGLLIASAGQRVVYALRLRVFDHLQRLSIAFHKNSRSGDLSARLTSDIQAIQDLVSTGLNNLLTNSFTVIGILLVVTIVNARMALLMLCATPLLLFLAGSYKTRIRQASRRLRSIEGQLGATAHEKFSAIQVVQAFGNEEHEAGLFAQQTRRSLDAGLQVTRLQSELSPLVDLVSTLALAAITWLGAREVLEGGLTLGYLLLFITYLRAMLSPVRQLAKLASVFSKADASADRIQEVLDIAPDVRDQPGAKAAPALRGAVTFEHISFSYRKDTPVLQDVSARIKPGMTVALVGPTGSGKSTLLGLIPRFHDPAAGRVLVDGVDVRGYTLRSLRDQIGLVLQEPVLFTGTIRDNIAYGRAGVSDVEILRAAKLANVHEFAQRLPDAYATVIGERGGTLSGGQRQRIAIARAIVRNAPILLLDEPTTGLDAESEALVMEALYRLMEGRTTFVIAHRLATIQRADRILVLREGQIVEAGTHAKLLRAGGAYARLHALQFGDAPAGIAQASM
jgi:ATP-binding cassette, subfamily B, bacterial